MVDVTPLTASAARETSIPTERGSVGLRGGMDVLGKEKSLTLPKFEHQSIILQHNPEIQVSYIRVCVCIYGQVRICATICEQFQYSLKAIALPFPLPCDMVLLFWWIKFSLYMWLCFIGFTFLVYVEELHFLHFSRKRRDTVSRLYLLRRSYHVSFACVVKRNMLYSQFCVTSDFVLHTKHSPWSL